MNVHAKKVLHSLLEKYENSKLSKGETPHRKVRITFNFNTRTMPNYFSEDSYLHRPEIEEAMRQLESKGYIELIYDDYRYGLERVILNIEKVEDIYTQLNRKSPHTQKTEILHVLTAYKPKTMELEAIIDILNKKVSHNEAIKTWFNPKDKDELNQILIALDALLTNDETISKRRFSTLIFQDSKKLEHFSHKIYQCYKLINNASKDMNTFFEEHGIVSTPTYVHIKGKAIISLYGTDFNLEELGEELVLSSKQLPHVTLKDIDYPQVTTVENYTSFTDMKNVPGLCIYLAGFHNQAKTMVLKAIKKHHPQITFYHFGDLDVGGFKIFMNLCLKTDIPFQPLYMDVETFNNHLHTSKPLNDSEIKQLKEMLKNDAYAMFHDVMKRMLETKKKLEQEAIDFSFNINE